MYAALFSKSPKYAGCYYFAKKNILFTQNEKKNPSLSRNLNNNPLEFSHSLNFSSRDQNCMPQNRDIKGGEEMLAMTT